jgi:hypothetical protein
MDKNLNKPTAEVPNTPKIDRRTILRRTLLLAGGVVAAAATGGKAQEAYDHRLDEEYGTHIEAIVNWRGRRDMVHRHSFGEIVRIESVDDQYEAKNTDTGEVIEDLRKPKLNIIESKELGPIYEIGIPTRLLANAGEFNRLRINSNLPGGLNGSTFDVNLDRIKEMMRDKNAAHDELRFYIPAGEFDVTKVSDDLRISSQSGDNISFMGLNRGRDNYYYDIRCFKESGITFDEEGKEVYDLDYKDTVLSVECNQKI